MDQSLHNPYKLSEPEEQFILPNSRSSQQNQSSSMKKLTTRCITRIYSQSIFNNGTHKNVYSNSLMKTQESL